MRIVALSALLGGFLLIPPFVFAQATDPTQDEAALLISEQDAEKAIQNVKKYQNDLTKLIEERTQQILRPEEITKKTLSDYLDVKISPKNPKPNEFVAITIESYLSDLQKATMSWSLNGKLVSRGIAQTVFSFQNGPSGKTTRISVTVTTNTGNSITKEFSFTPVGVTLLWEADTYTPPFYKGKALMVPQARVRVTAVPDTNGIATGNLVYTWTQDRTVDTNNSGYGKNFYSFIGPIPLSNKDVRVTVSSLDDRTKSEMRVNIPLARPFILFYEKHPLLGVLYNKPFSTEHNMDKKELSISAEPYFFSNERSDISTINYNWTVNGALVQNYGRTITLRNDAGKKGDSTVSLSMRGAKQTFQDASTDLKMHFTEESIRRPTF